MQKIRDVPDGSGTVGNYAIIMSGSKRDAYYAYCNICHTDFSEASGGIHEVKRHIESKKHKELAAGMAG